MIDANSSFERIKVLYKTFRLSKEEKPNLMKQISPKTLASQIACDQHDNESEVCSIKIF
jgi:hypothetical protein